MGNNADMLTDAVSPSKRNAAEEEMSSRSSKRVRKDVAREEDEADEPEEDASQSLSESFDLSQGVASQIGEEAVGKIGLIKKIFVQHFMCHTRLSVDFGRHINFVVGQNGSGKSAILAAIQLGLGGRANVTGRGSSISNLIQHGKSFAVIRITLINEGEFAYKPELFGDEIEIERTIKKTGSSYKIKNKTTNKVVSTAVRELNEMVEEMALQVDNPIVILTQEESKRFLKTNSPKELYKLFAKATMLDRLDKEKQDLAHSQRDIKSRIENHKAGSNDMKLEVLEAERKYKELTLIQNLEEKFKELERKAVWTTIKEYEDSLAQTEVELQASEKDKARLFEKLEKYKKRQSETTTSVPSLVEEYRKRNEKATELENAFKTETKRKNAITKERHALQNARKDCDKSLKRKDMEKNKILKQIQDAQKENNRDQIKEQQQEIDREIEKIQQEMGRIQAKEKKARRDKLMLEPSLNKKEQDKISMTNDYKSREKHLNSAKRDLAEMQGAGSGFSIEKRVSILGAKYKQLYDAIQKAKWKEIPQGPIGAHITLKDKKWATAIQTSLGSGLFAFVVTNVDDQRALRTLAHKFGVGNFIEILRAKTESRFKVGHPAQYLERQGYKTVEQMIHVENDNVFNALVNFSGISRNVLIAEEEVARKIAFEEYKHLGRSMGNIFTIDGHRCMPGAARRYYMNKNNNQRIMLHEDMSGAIKSSEEQIERIKQDLQRLKSESAKVTAECNEAKKQSITLQKEIDGYLRNITKLNKDQDKLKEKKWALEPTEEVDIASLEELLQEVEGEMESIKSQLQKYIDEEKSKRQEEKDASEVANQIAADLSAAGDKAEEIQSQLDKIDAARKETESKLKTYTEAYKSNEETIQKQVTNQQELKKLIAEEREAAAAAGYEEVRVGKETSAELSSKIATIQSQIQKEIKKRGDPEEITRDYIEKKSQYENANKEVNTLDEFIKVLENSIINRNYAHEDLRKHISHRTKIHFQALLESRGYKANLSVNHESEDLQMEVQPRAVDEEKPRGKKKKAEKKKEAKPGTSSLSGGERSFTTASLILALWEAMDSPIRCLDEFDVFMDAYNRQVAIDMMIGASRTMSSKQFILLSPLTMKILEKHQGPDIRVIRMNPPERGQTTLVTTDE
eukprot:m.57679 g.57679  ORF g.57679 m.57679 type:complete len:1141 (+) comp11124_c0_seq1:119-3541(+)